MTDEEPRASTYRKDLYYVNRMVGGKSYHRSEGVVSKFGFFMTKLWWYISRKSYITFKSFHVIREVTKDELRHYC